MIPSVRYCYLLLFFTFGVKTICFSQNNQSWYSPLFLEGAGHLYYEPEMVITPEIIFESVLAEPGFSISVGYEWRRLRFSLASGYTRITGVYFDVPNESYNELGMSYIPLTFKLGYEQPLWRNLSARADIGFGFRFSQATYYKDEIDRILGILSYRSGISPLGEGRLSFVYTLPGNYLQLFAGTKGYLLFVTSGPIPSGAFEAGLVFRPFTASTLVQANIAERRQARILPIIPEPEPEVPEPPVEEAEPEIEEIVPEVIPVIIPEIIVDDHEKEPAIIERRRR